MITHPDSRENKSEPEVMYSASDSFLRCIAIGGEFRRLMDAILAEGSSNDTHIIITAVLKSLGLYSFLYVSYSSNAYSLLSTS